MLAELAEETGEKRLLESIAAAALSSSSYNAAGGEVGKGKKKSS